MTRLQILEKMLIVQKFVHEEREVREKSCLPEPSIDEQVSLVLAREAESYCAEIVGLLEIH